MAGGKIEIVEASHEVNVDNLEDVVHTHDEFYVGHVLVHDVTALGEVHETVAVGILRQKWIILVAEVAP